MTGRRAPGAAQERARRIVQHLLGGHGGLAALGAVAFLVSLAWLSNLKPAEVADLDGNADSVTGIEDFRNRYGGLSWRMPLEAIAYHLPRLEQAIFIVSEGAAGSARQWPIFRRLVERCFPGAALRAREIGELDSRWGAGLDFEDVDRVSQATDAAYRALRDARLPNMDILIDITGGQKPNAVVGTAVALAEGRRIQYVACSRDTGVCHLSVYDVTYDG